MIRVIRILITGGPCSGKTKVIKFLKEKLTKLRIPAVFVPEVATSIILAGPHPETLSIPEMINWQDLNLQAQILYEDQIYLELAKITARVEGKDFVVMLCDRGILDGSVYTPRDEFTRLLKKSGLSWVLARDARYDAVIHLVTAADGAEKFYNNDNEARTETPEEARVYDGKTKYAYLGHPHQRIIDNSTDFKGKRKRLLAKILRSIGIPEKYETERKYLVHTRPDIANFPVPVQPIEIYQTYLKKDADGHSHRVRWREQAGEGIVYYETFKIGTESAVSSIENERVITAKEYWNLLKLRDPDREEIYKTRHYFIWKNQVFELDFFHLPSRHAGLTLLEIELDDENDKVELPEWLGPVAEVTEDPKYKNSKLAKKIPA